MQIITNNRKFEPGTMFHESTSNSFVNCAFFYPSLRQGLFQLFQQLKLKSILLPSFCPEGLINPFIQLGYDIQYYDVDVNGNIKNNFDKITTDVFIYIHYFGLYNEYNIQKIKKYISSDTIFIEDFAHTVFSYKLKLTGDYCTFSFTKMIGVSEGSCILFNNTPILPTPYQRQRGIDNRLKLSLYLHLMQQSYLSNKYISLFFDMFLFLVGLYDSYKILMSSYTSNYPPIGKYSNRILHTINLEGIVNKRIQFAIIYYENLNPKLLLSLPKEYYIQQALFAFPILVKHRDDFSLKLKEKGVGPLYLTSHWWFGAQVPNALCEKHLLLPINHNLSEQDIYKVVAVVNSLYIENEKMYNQNE
ncbi:MAG: hypothetical protein RR190_03870 [Bacteroidales bacterium]